MITDILMSMESMFFTWSALISSSFISIVASISDLAASILLPTMFLILVFSMCSSKGVVSEDICFYCSISHDENSVVFFAPWNPLRGGVYLI